MPRGRGPGLSLVIQGAAPTTTPATTAGVVIYGGTSAAVVAAVHTKALGKSVVIVSPDKHLGGLSSGGLAREFYRRVKQHYDPLQYELLVRDLAAGSRHVFGKFDPAPEAHSTYVERRLGGGKSLVARARIRPRLLERSPTPDPVGMHPKRVYPGFSWTER